MDRAAHAPVQPSLINPHQPMTITTTIAFIIALITLPIIILLWATESKQQKAKRMRARGKSYKAIATLINVSPTTARRYALA